MSLVLDWTPDGAAPAGSVARAGAVEVARVMFDPSNRFYVWSSPLADDAWGYGPTEAAAQAGFEAWLLGWLDNFRPFLAANGR